MAHNQYPQYHGGAGYGHHPSQFSAAARATELDSSGRPQLEGQIFEMPGESAAPRAEEPAKRPVQAQDADIDAGKVLANPWPFYLDQDVKTESRGEDAAAASAGGAKGGDYKNAEANVEPPQANPWAYFGPMSPEEEEEEEDGGGLGIKVGDAKAKSEHVAALPPPLPVSSSPPPPLPLLHGTQDAQGGGGASPAAAESPSAEFRPAPLRVSRKQVPGAAAAAAAPAFKPYLPPADSAVTVAPLKLKSQRPPEGAPGDALPYRPYRPAGHDVPAESKASEGVDGARPPVMPFVPASPPPPQAYSLLGGPLQTKAPVVSGSPNPTQQQQQQGTGSSGSTETPLDGAHHHYQPLAASPQPPAIPPPLPPALPQNHPPAIPPALPQNLPPPASLAPPIPTPLPTVAVANPPSIAAPTPHHTPQPPVPPASARPVHHPSPSPSNSGPTPGHQAYASPPHSAPTSSIPSPEMTSYPFQPINQGQPMYASTPTPPAASPAPPGSMSYPPQPPYMPPLPTSSYDIPQPTYASSSPVETPPPQPPRPQFQQAPMGAYSPQPSPQSPPPNMYANAPRPGTQPPPCTQPSLYGLPYGPAIAPHQHQYPTQATYAAAPDGNNIPPSPGVQDPYASPPLPPRPATTLGQPQVFTGFTPHVVAYPPPPRRVFDPPPAVAGPPGRKASGGTSGGRLFSSSSALKWIDKTGKGLENRLDAVLGSQGASTKPPPQPPRPS